MEPLCTPLPSHSRSQRWLELACLQRGPICHLVTAMPAALACSLAVMPAARNAWTFTLFSGSSCITAEKINKCLKPRLLVKASADTRGPHSPGSSLKMGCEGGPAGDLAPPPI